MVIYFSVVFWSMTYRPELVETGNRSQSVLLALKIMIESFLTGVGGLAAKIVALSIVWVATAISYCSSLMRLSSTIFSSSLVVRMISYPNSLATLLMF